MHGLGLTSRPYVTQGLRIVACRFLDIELEAQIVEFSSLKFFNAAGVREFAINCTAVTRILMPFVSFDI